MLLLFFLLSNWSSDSVISDGYTSYSNQHNIVCAANGDVHSIWFKWHQYSDDYSIWSACYSGTNWTLPQQVSPSSYILVGHPSIATFQSNLYAVWESGREYSDLVLRRFIGGNWEDSVIVISSGPLCSYTPSLACAMQGVVHIVWEKGYEIHYMNLFGSFLSCDTVLSNSGVYAAYPCISAFNNNLYVVWVDLRDSNFELYFKTFNGHEWSDDIRVTNSSNASIFPSLCVDSLGIPNVVWQEDGNDGFQIFHTTYEQNNFTAPTLLVDSPGDAISPSITSVGTDLHLVWSDSRSGDWEIYYKTLGSEDLRLTNSPGVSANPSICASDDGNLYLLFWDTRVLPAKVYFKECVSSEQNVITPSTLIVSPNPFTHQTVIEFIGQKTEDRSQKTEVRIQIYDLSGRLVKTLFSSRLSVVWDGCDNRGNRLSSGIYFVVFNGIAFVKSSVGDEKIVKKVILLK